MGGRFGKYGDFKRKANIRKNQPVNNERAGLLNKLEKRRRKGGDKPRNANLVGFDFSLFPCKNRPKSIFNAALITMVEYKFTEYFEKEVLRKRPYIKKEWCIEVLRNFVQAEPQEHNRFRFWAPVEELGGRYIRVVTLEDKTTIHNAFPDRGFKS